MEPFSRYATTPADCRSAAGQSTARSAARLTQADYQTSADRSVHVKLSFDAIPAGRRESVQ